MYKTPANIILPLKKKKVCMYICISADPSPWDSMSFLISTCRMVNKLASAPKTVAFPWRKSPQDAFALHRRAGPSSLFCSKRAVKSQYQTPQVWLFWEFSVHSAQHHTDGSSHLLSPGFKFLQETAQMFTPLKNSFVFGTEHSRSKLPGVYPSSSCL